MKKVYARKYYLKTKEHKLAYSKSWQKSNAEKVRLYKRRTRLKAIGWTPERHELFRKEQNNKCAICDTEMKFTGVGAADRAGSDHIHGTLNPRGLLCSKCNQAIGLLGDKVSTILKAAEYVKFWEEYYHDIEKPLIGGVKFCR